MYKRLSSEHGVSIVAAILSLLILSMLGSVVVTVVATNHEYRARHTAKQVAFYAMQTGFEYVLREMDQGGYPVVTGKSFSNGTFTTEVIQATKNIVVTANVGNTKKKYQMQVTSLAADCLEVNGSGAYAYYYGGNKQVKGIMVRRSCPNFPHAITIDKMTVSWTPNAGELLKAVSIGGVTVIDAGAGSGWNSGTLLNINDYKFSDTSFDELVLTLNYFTGSKTFTITFVMNDGTTKTVAVPVS